MSVVPSRDLVSVQEYLAGELRSPIRHEYLGGVVYAMAGARNAHDLLASNALVAWRRSEQGFVREIHSGLGATIPLPEISCELRLVDVYDGAELARADPP